jgi:thiosulfate/3-mercaptopyruvate sulfurtransferase
MTVSLSPIISVKELYLIRPSADLVLIDVCNGTKAKERYKDKHLEGALYVDLDSQLADIKEDFAIGGRHPLPTADSFARLLGNLGISGESHVVVYDDSYGANAAARFYWMIKSLGHHRVQVLNGGLQAAEKTGFPLSNAVVEPIKSPPYPGDSWQLPMVTLDEVDHASLCGSAVIIDVRSSERYRGEVEPIDLIAGHIPNAINIPFTYNLDAEGLFLPPEELATIYKPLLNSNSGNGLIVHCGSGVTACHTLLAMEYCGIGFQKLYVGSWSEWSRRDKPMVCKG